MAKKSSGGKLILFVLVALIGGLAAFGYFKQTSKLGGEKTPEKIERALLVPKPNDIIMGDINALTTMVEYSSLSCPHCAHFHETILPMIEKEFITTGKVKLIIRHFPLNEPAIKAAEIVECAGNNGLKRENFVKVLFNMQAQWAVSEENFLKNLKQIALVGGIDSAAFDSCTTDKELETRILTMRQEAETKLGVTSTPSFFINGVKYEGPPNEDGFRKALSEAPPEAK